MVPRLSQSSDAHSESNFQRASISSKGPYVPIKRGSYGSEILENIAIEQSGPIEKAKVAIPRQRAAVGPRNPGRVLRACESCRSRKTKCSGDTPVCRQCHELKATCVYPLAFRERTKQQIRVLSQRLRDCENLLKEVEHIVPERISRRIHLLLSQGDHSENATKEVNIAMSLMHDADSISSRSVGSLDAVDKIEDSNMADESPPPRDVEKSSDMSWREQRPEEGHHRTKSQSDVPDPSKTDQSHDQFHRHNVNCGHKDFGIGVTNRVRTC